MSKSYPIKIDKLGNGDVYTWGHHTINQIEKATGIKVSLVSLMYAHWSISDNTWIVRDYKTNGMKPITIITLEEPN